MGGVPPKSGLGRGLGTLLRDQQRPPAGSAQPAFRAAPRPALSHGMATLLKGANGNGRAVPATPAVASTGKLRTTRFALLLADVLLCGLVTRLAFSRSHHWGFGEALLCAAAVVTGAWLACLALTVCKNPDTH